MVEEGGRDLKTEIISVVDGLDGGVREYLFSSNKFYLWSMKRGKERAIFSISLSKFFQFLFNVKTEFLQCVGISSYEKILRETIFLSRNWIGVY